MSKLIISVALVGLLLGTSRPAAADVTGNEWRKLDDENLQSLYIIGAIDGYVSGTEMTDIVLEKLVHPAAIEALRDNVSRMSRCGRRPGVTRGTITSRLSRSISETTPSIGISRWPPSSSSP